MGRKKLIYIIEDDISINHGIELTLGTEYEYKHYYSLMVLRLRVRNLLSRGSIGESYAAEIYTHGKKLESLIEALVKMSRLEIGVFRYEKSPACAGK